MRPCTIGVRTALPRPPGLPRLCTPRHIRVRMRTQPASGCVQVDEGSPQQNSNMHDPKRCLQGSARKAARHAGGASHGAPPGPRARNKARHRARVRARDTRAGNVLCELRDPFLHALGARVRVRARLRARTRAQATCCASCATPSCTRWRCARRTTARTTWTRRWRRTTRRRPSAAAPRCSRPAAGRRRVRPGGPRGRRWPRPVRQHAGAGGLCQGPYPPIMSQVEHPPCIRAKHGALSFTLLVVVHERHSCSTAVEAANRQRCRKKGAWRIALTMASNTSSTAQNRAGAPGARRGRRRRRVLPRARVLAAAALAGGARRLGAAPARGGGRARGRGRAAGRVRAGGRGRSEGRGRADGRGCADRRGRADRPGHAEGRRRAGGRDPCEGQGLAECCAARPARPLHGQTAESAVQGAGMRHVAPSTSRGFQILDELCDTATTGLVSGWHDRKPSPTQCPGGTVCITQAPASTQHPERAACV